MPPTVLYCHLLPARGATYWIGVPPTIGYTYWIVLTFCNAPYCQGALLPPATAVSQSD